MGLSSCDGHCLRGGRSRALLERPSEIRTGLRPLARGSDFVIGLKHGLTCAESTPLSRFSGSNRPRVLCVRCRIGKECFIRSRSRALLCRLHGPGHGPARVLAGPRCTQFFLGASTPLLAGGGTRRSIRRRILAAAVSKRWYVQQAPKGLSLSIRKVLLRPATRQFEVTRSAAEHCAHFER